MGSASNSRWVRKLFSVLTMSHSHPEDRMWQALFDREIVQIVSEPPETLDNTALRNKLILVADQEPQDPVKTQLCADL